MASINAALRRLRMPPLRGGDLPANPVPRLKVIWNPQAYAVPELPANQPARYYPGAAFVDVVGNDIYGEPRIKWAEQEAYYRRYAWKPFAIPEWGLWGRDDPQYIRAMARFARTHRRLELLVYVNGKRGSSLTWPRGRGAARSIGRSSRRSARSSRRPMTSERTRRMILQSDDRGSRWRRHRSRLSTTTGMPTTTT